MITLEQLNAQAPGKFAAALGGIFEHSAWVAQRAAAARPFASRLQLLDAMRAAVDKASPEEQLALIRAHPRLGVRGRSAHPLTAASAREQRRAGLDSCTAAQASRLEQLNALYLERFGFPFILAVRGHDPASIIDNLECRIGNDSELERYMALSQIGAIAAYRLADMVASAPGAEIVARLERLARPSAPAGATTDAARVLVREWMQAAGLEVWQCAGGYLVGRVDGADFDAKTLVAGVCRDPPGNAVRYQGHAACVIAIEVAQQLRRQGARPAFGLAVLARPDDGLVGDGGSLLAGQAPHAWVELSAADATDTQGIEILQALNAAQLQDAAATLICQANAALGRRSLSVLTAPAAEQAAHALEELLGRAQTAA